MDRNRIWLLSISSLDGQGSPFTLRFSSGQYLGDGVAYEPRIKQAGLYSEGLYSADILPSSRSSFGVTELINTDGALNYLLDHAIDGRDVNLDVVLDGVKTNVFTATALRFEFSRTNVNLVLRSPSEPLETQRESSLYDGSNVLPNGLEGTSDDIQGNVKPRLYGEAINASPVQVNTAKLIYQISDLDDCIVSAVYDNGSPLTFDGDYTNLTELEGTGVPPSGWTDWEPDPGKWRRYNGYIRLGNIPVGNITVDASVTNASLGDVFESIVTEAGYTMSSGKTVLNSYGDARLLSTSEDSYISLLDRLAKSAGCYWRRMPDGTIEAGLIDLPNNPNTTIRPYSILDIDLTSSGSGTNGIPVWKVEVSADRIETTQDDLAGIVSQERIERLKKQSRYVIAEDSAVKTRHRLSESKEINSDLASLTQASSVASNILSLVSERRDTVSVTVRYSEANDINILDTITIITDRFGYNNGRDMLVIRKVFDPVQDRLELELWG